MTMPFGNFKGTEVRDPPDDYLMWLISTVELREPLLSAIQSEQIGRSKGVGVNDLKELRHQAITVRCIELPLLRDILEAGYRSVARKKHPDVGGSDAEMIRLNLLAESLRGQFSALEPKS